jgi:glutamate-1-semialdehyde aminotransferase
MTGKDDSDARYARSRELLARASRWMPRGVSSPFRAQAPVPLYIADAEGCRLTDVDGNRYLDYGLAWGPLILGHRHPRLVEAMRRQADQPHTLGAQHELEPLVEANRIGTHLRDGIQERADARAIPLRVTGFGTAFALHFTARRELGCYRDTLEDDRGRLGRFMRRALDRGVAMVADGRFYVSTAHGEDDVAETLRAIDAVLDEMT